jgi:Cu+-exporting ATPase
MHPEVTSDQPGRCPECNMELEPRAGVEAQHEEHRHDA